MTQQETVAGSTPTPEEVSQYKKLLETDVSKLILETQTVDIQLHIAERLPALTQIISAILYFVLARPLDELLPPTIKNLAAVDQHLLIALSACYALTLTQYKAYIPLTREGNLLRGFLRELAGNQSRFLLTSHLYVRSALQRAKEEAPCPFDAPVLAALITMDRMFDLLHIPLAHTVLTHFLRKDIPNLLDVVRKDPGVKPPLLEQRIELIKCMTNESNTRTWASFLQTQLYPHETLIVQRDHLGTEICEALLPFLDTLYNIRVTAHELSLTLKWPRFLASAMHHSEINAPKEENKKSTHWNVVLEGVKECLKQGIRFVLLDCPGNLASLPMDAVATQIDSSDQKHLFGLAKYLIKFKDSHGSPYILVYLGAEEDLKEDLSKRSNSMGSKFHAGFTLNFEHPLEKVVVKRPEWCVTVAPPKGTLYISGNGEEEPLEAFIKRWDRLAKIRAQPDGSFTCTFNLPRTSKFWEHLEQVYNIFHPEWTKVFDETQLHRLGNNHSTLTVETGNSNTFINNLLSNTQMQDTVTALKTSTYYNNKNRFSHLVIIGLKEHTRKEFRELVEACLGNCKTEKAKHSKSSFPFIRTMRPIAPVLEQSAQQGPAKRLAAFDRPETTLDTARALARKLKGQDNTDNFILLFVSNCEEETREFLGSQTKWEDANTITLTRISDGALYDRAAIIQGPKDEAYQNRVKTKGCNQVTTETGNQVFALYSAEYFLRAIG
jgi:hypothetical protein